jgi:hypothetical protein
LCGVERLAEAKLEAMDANEIKTERWRRKAVAALLARCREAVAVELERRAHALRGIE